MENSSATRGGVAGKIVGAVMFAAGVAAIWLWPKAKPEVVAEDVVRPVRSMVVSGKVALPELRFPGRVRAFTTRDLTFEVSGRLVDFNSDRGRHVKKGEVLAKLDTRDFEADVAQAEAEAQRAELTLQRTKSASENGGGVSKEEVSRAEANAKTAQAQLDKARKALESCVITAPYDGVVADTYPQSLDMVGVGQKILTLQSTDMVKIDVSIPETFVISRKFVDTVAARRAFVVFDSLAGRDFDVKFEEFTAQADDRTQTFTATFSMPAQEDFIILPGMSVTLVVAGGEKAAAADAPLAVPAVAVGADEAGGHFVWKLVKAEKEGEYRTVRQAVVTDGLVGTDYPVMSGLADGDRIAVAGVSLLSEGRIVTLWKE